MGGGGLCTTDRISSTLLYPTHKKKDVERFTWEFYDCQSFGQRYKTKQLLLPTIIENLNNKKKNKVIEFL